MSRPGFIGTLLNRPLPELTPRRLTDSQNPPYDTHIQSQIADLHVHPLLESALHLLNDDLFSAHFLLRKMQEDEWGKYLHGILHLMEGDIDQNAAKWYQDTDPSLFTVFWPSKDVALKYLGRVQEARVSGKMEQEVREDKWNELRAVFAALEDKFGYGKMDGTKAYTKDEKPSHKSRVLGEGYRRFDQAGNRIG